MSNHKEKIISLIKNRKVATTSEIANELKISWNTAEKYMLELIIDGKLVKIKKEKVNLWMLREK